MEIGAQHGQLGVGALPVVAVLRLPLAEAQPVLAANRHHLSQVIGRVHAEDVALLRRPADFTVDVHLVWPGCVIEIDISCQRVQAVVQHRAIGIAQ